MLLSDWLLFYNAFNRSLLLWCQYDRKRWTCNQTAHDTTTLMPHNNGVLNLQHIEFLFPVFCLAWHKIKHQTSRYWPFVKGIHQWPVDPPPPPAPTALTTTATTNSPPTRQKGQPRKNRVHVMQSSCKDGLQVQWFEIIWPVRSSSSPSLHSEWKFQRCHRNWFVIWMMRYIYLSINFQNSTLN